MVIRRVLALGVEVDTVVFDPRLTPGSELAGEVRFTGGSVDQQVEGVAVALTVGEEDGRPTEFHRISAAGPFLLPADAAYTVPFRFTLPWETPLTKLDRRKVRNTFVHLRTELELAGAVDRFDSDLLVVDPLPVQSKIVEALYSLGFRLDHADLVRGPRPAGTLPIWQSFRFEPWRRLPHPVVLDITFVPGPMSTEMILMAEEPKPGLGIGDAVGGLLSAQLQLLTGPNTSVPATAELAAVPYVRSTVEHSWLDEELDWEGWIDERIRAAVDG